MSITILIPIIIAIIIIYSKKRNQKRKPNEDLPNNQNEKASPIDKDVKM